MPKSSSFIEKNYPLLIHEEANEILSETKHRKEREHLTNKKQDLLDNLALRPVWRERERENKKSREKREKEKLSSMQIK